MRTVAKKAVMKAERKAAQMEALLAASLDAATVVQKELCWAASRAAKMVVMMDPQLAER